MITITVVLDDTGLLKSCDVRGHAGAGKQGHDIVCAAVSVLVRTAQTVLSGRKDITARSEAPGRGIFSLETQAHSQAGQDFLAAAGSFLVEGLQSVAGEYPGNCVMTIKQWRN